ncbi:DUF1559 domain-containing protein [Novipirellula artificiosorum]|uniref:DUF1559 domain-containing protein n=1 Tax=Novipirellula artificiosorum TaxID=2528016 RepID=A0A5C6DJD1_9BACT|nr:DUF1559 domain-containing protein [Novipirellula artificiosorum]TWU35009.1 hypothetical protein Poly41_41530 [Novipirellula artificiosorum]
MERTQRKGFRKQGWSIRFAFTVLELLVTLVAIGIVLGLLLPAVGLARESARRVQCVSHLRQIGIALHHHHDVHRNLPPGWQFDRQNQSAYGWAVPLLPFMEQTRLAECIDVCKPVDAPSHALARQTSLPIMLCPSDITELTFTLFEEGEEGKEDGEATSVGSGSSRDLTPLVRLPTANFVGVFGTIEPDDEIPAPIGDGAFVENRAMRFRDFSRGTASTLVVGERTMAQVPSTWFGVRLSGEDAAARLVGSALEGINNPMADECDFSSRHGGGANFLWGDGHVTFVTERVDLQEYHRWSQLRIHPQGP